MNDDERIYVVACLASPECFTGGHHPNRYEDAITCADCETVAAYAALACEDVDEANRRVPTLVR